MRKHYETGFGSLLLKDVRKLHCPLNTNPKQQDCFAKIDYV